MGSAARRPRALAARILLGGRALGPGEGRERLRLFREPWASHLASSLGPGAPALFALTAALSGAGLWAAWRARPGWAALALLELAVPLVLLHGVPFGHGFAPRYLLFFLPVLAVLQAQGLLWVARRLRVPALASALAALLVIAAHAPAWQRSFEPKRAD